MHFCEHLQYKSLNTYLSDENTHLSLALKCFCLDIMGGAEDDGLEGRGPAGKAGFKGRKKLAAKWMFYIKKLIFALKKLSKKIKGNSINALVLNFAIFVSGGHCNWSLRTPKSQLRHCSKEQSWIRLSKTDRKVLIASCLTVIWKTRLARIQC